jgi:hypothetical protein
MATATMYLKDVLEMEPDIGLSKYPLFDEAYRPALNQKIIDHFWNREIGQETISLFTHQLRVRMNNIMPLYNQHYEASRIKFDPLKTIDMKNVGESDSTATSTANSATTSASDAKSRAVNSDHPQELLSASGDYASSSGDTIGTSSATGSTDNTGSNTQSTKSEGGVSGFQGNAAAVIFQLRATFVNVDMMVINELEDLFYGLWGNGDDFTTNRNGYGYDYFYPYFS